MREAGTRLASTCPTEAPGRTRLLRVWRVTGVHAQPAGHSTGFRLHEYSVNWTPKRSTDHSRERSASAISATASGCTAARLSRIGQRAHVRFQDEYALQAAAFGLDTELQVRQQRQDAVAQHAVARGGS